MIRAPGGSLVGEVIRRTKGGKRRIMASKQPTHAEARRMLAAHPVKRRA